MNMPGTLLTITDAGRAALIAPANAGPVAHRIAEIGLGTEPFDATPDLRALPGERKRVVTFAGMHVDDDTVHVTIKDDSDDQFTLHGFGLYLDDGTLFAAYGQATPIMEKSPAAILLLSADVHVASIDTAALHFGEASFMNPPASIERQGVIELATAEEAAGGTDDVRAITAATLKPLLDKKADLAGADFTGPVTLDKPLRFAGSQDPEKNHISDGTNGASRYANNLAIRSWWGLGLGTTHEGMPVPVHEFSHWFDTRNGDASFRGTLQVDGYAHARTPAFNDQSNKLATTDFVEQAILFAAIGQIILEARTGARIGFLQLNGAVLLRKDYPALWAYAQGTGMLVSEPEWLANHSACFSRGNGETTFRIPELRGEFLRCWDDGRRLDIDRAVGSVQESQNRVHGHGAHADSVGDHGHIAHTDAQGQHAHHVHDPGHVHANLGGGKFMVHHPPETDFNIALDGGGRNGRSNPTTAPSATGISVAPAGHHAHGVNVQGSGAHSHGIHVAPDGGHEARPRNVALLALIRAY